VRLVEPALLLALHRGSAHGYTLIDHLAEFDLTGMHPSAIYRVLREMEELGWVSSAWDDLQTQGPPRRVYRLTKLGDEILALWVEDLHDTRGMVDRLLGSYRRHMEEGLGDYH
jgi:PadR family transcriptional regulator PadR